MKDNKLIADFMDLPIDISQPSGILNYGFDDVWFEECELSFEASWDWLMPVIHKILHNNDDEAFYKFSMGVSKAMFNNNIRDAHSIVVEFIKQHNDER